ncbi:hypothetical protein TWF679_001737 [Orbilia oligospora]|uniref:G-patch domain-containing protein n=1 Tax=Orbilia oligospora TaxID=2813651 RepID=A0A8H8UUT1_ORBOL|nr:hypothetical protein TWF679_001737 [Orbilia oligospora]
MTMPSTAPNSRVKPSAQAFTDLDDEEDAFSKLASRNKPSTRGLPPVEPKSLSRPPTMVSRPSAVSNTINNNNNNDDDDDDDYMSMTVADPTTTETPLQRLKRRKVEASIRGNPLSKAELAEQEKLKRDLGLATSILNNTNSKGLKMMKAMGYSTGSALGKAAPTPTGGTDTKDTRRLEPIKPIVRESRTGIGHESDLKRKFGDINPVGGEGNVTKRQELSPEGYRNRLTQEAQQRRYEAQIFAAQSICEKLVAQDPPESYNGPPKKSKEGTSEEAAAEDERETDGQAEGTLKHDFFNEKPTFTQIKQINLIYRGLLYRRAVSDLKACLKKKEQDSLTSSKSSYIPNLSLPKYNTTGEFNVDDEIAMGAESEDIVTEQELEDQELEEFEKREAKDRLDEIVRYLRSQWRYCFWCKARYATDGELDRECPGLTEEDHD